MSKPFIPWPQASVGKTVVFLACWLGWTVMETFAQTSASKGGAPACTLVGAAYRADVAFPQFMHLWSEGWSLPGPDGEPLQYAKALPGLGAYLQVYIQNTTSNVLHWEDVKLEGVSLCEAIAFGDRKAGRAYPASIRFSKLPREELARLSAVGEPVWWKVDPPCLPPGGFGEITVRLRRGLKTGAAQVQVVSSNGVGQARVEAGESPRFRSLSFNLNLDSVYGYVRHPLPAGKAPLTVLFDEQDVTAGTTLATDTNVNITPLVIRLKHPLERGTFHCVRAKYADGSVAVTGCRAWSDELVYGMWGYVNEGKTVQERVDYYLGDLRRHNVNAVMESYGGEVANYLSGERGLEHSRQVGIRAMRNEPGKVLNPLYYFLKDEPDAHDFAVSQLEPTQRLGALGQYVVEHGREIREQDRATPQLLNVDNTYKPENWYMYAQVPDVYCADPYFQEQQRIVWNERPSRAASFVKPWYVLGVATICESACAPKPLHIILNSVRHDIKQGGFRFATPAEKTVELFYALGAGAKGFSYWWYTPYGEFHGCGARDEAAVALWRQIGRLGAQTRLAGPVLTRSCPAELPVKAPVRLWTRTLLAGTDTLVLLAVNENIASDRLGTVVVPLPKAAITLKPPAWLKATDGFELTPGGPQELNWKAENGQLQVSLDNTEVARMVFLTSDSSLRSRLEELYRTRFAENARFLEESAVPAK